MPPPKEPDESAKVRDPLKQALTMPVAQVAQNRARAAQKPSEPQGDTTTPTEAPESPSEPDEFNLTYDPILSWDSQVIQYPELGEPNTIELFLGDESENFPGLPPINCLLWRDGEGRIRGILNHYPADYPPYEKAGNVNVFVQPGWKRRGIGTALIEKAIESFGELNFHQQTYSPEGLQFMLRYRRKHGLH